MARLTGIHRDPIMPLNLTVGTACDRLHDAIMHALHVPFLQLDET